MIVLTVDMCTLWLLLTKLYWLSLTDYGSTDNGSTDYGCTDRGSADYGSSPSALPYGYTDYVAVLTLAILAMHVPLLWLY
jgi:hypothetical protein